MSKEVKATATVVLVLVSILAAKNLGMQRSNRAPRMSELEKILDQAIALGWQPPKE